jgi:hypothetical protein
MQTKIKDVTNFEHPPANCRICGTDAKLIKYASFSYFYCSRCKDECDVFLKTDSSPRALKGQYVIHQDNDVVLSKPGVYRLEYTDGSTEWFEYKDRFGEIRLNGELLRSSTRLTDRDLPSRKPVSLAKGPDEGEATKGNGLGTIPIKAARSQGHASGGQRCYASDNLQKVFENLSGTKFSGRDYVFDPAADRIHWTDDNGIGWSVDNECFQAEYLRRTTSITVPTSPPDPVL